jgi:hypothetical protein
MRGTSSEGGGGRKNLTLTGEHFDDLVLRIMKDMPEGRGSPRRVALAIRQADVLSEEQIEGHIIHDITEAVRKSLRRHDQKGLPMFGPVRTAEDDEPEWRQRTLWDLDDYAFNIQTRGGAWISDGKVLQGMIDECFERHGVRFPMPKLKSDDDEEE